MEFIWHDGGRAACGYVGQTGDCVTRSIAIATGRVYRDVYRSLSDASPDTARHGVSYGVLSRYLGEYGWTYIPVYGTGLGELPRGVLVLSFEPDGRKRVGHVSCLIDHTVYDTWNPCEDPDYRLVGYWAYPSVHRDNANAIVVTPRHATEAAKVTQHEFSKILERVKALHRTASNVASTEGEIRNALRMMQNLMLKHNLSRSDIVDDDDASHVGMTRRACPLNGNKAYQWESMLADYMTGEIFPTVQFYRDRHGHRTLFWFYGPVDDVQQTIGLFRELLLTIATAAQLKYGGHTRGSGASYAEGYVKGLPRSYRDQNRDEAVVSEQSLIHARTLAIHSAARDWLWAECKIRLQTIRGSGRVNFDRSAHHAGQKDGATHQVSGPYGRKRLTHE